MKKFTPKPVVYDAIKDQAIKDEQKVEIKEEVKIKEPPIDISNRQPNVYGVSMAKFSVKGKYYDGQGNFLWNCGESPEVVPDNLETLTMEELRRLVEFRGGSYEDRGTAIDFILGRK